LPAQLVTLLRQHRTEQDAERKLARQLWHEEGWVFATPTGLALNHMTDYKQWKALLKAAGLRETRLHDARHTAATVLLILGQPERTVMSLMGWSTTDMAKRYQHVTDQIRAEVASQVDNLIWAARSADAEADAVYVRRESLAAILPLVEDRLLAENGDDDIDMEELALALADLRKALSAPSTDTQGEAK